MLFDEKYLKALPEEPLVAIMNICSTLIDFDAANSDHRDENYNNYLEMYALIKSFTESFEIQMSIKIPVLTDVPIDNIKSILIFSNNLRTIVSKEAELIMTNTTVEKSRAIFDGYFGKATVYKFSDGDLKRIQELIDQLRDIITKSKNIEEEYRSRLLKKLEKLQSELHKKVSDLNQFWGLVGEAGVAIGKFGKDAQPFVARVQEIVRIVWNVQARAEELQSGIVNKLLSEDSSFEE